MIRLDVYNDGTGTSEVGAYDVELIIPEGRQSWLHVKAHISEFDRSLGWAELMRRAVTSIEEAMLDSSSEGGTNV